MKKLLSILVLLTTLIVTSQNNEIKVEVKETNGKLMFYCTNTTDTTQEVILGLAEHKGLSGYTEPVRKTIASKGKKLFFTTTIKGKYNYRYSLKRRPLVKPKKTITLPKQKQLKDLSKLKKGIVVFNKSDCPRCNRTTNYLIENKIEFKYLDITKNQENKKLLSELMRENGEYGSFTTPVILVDGKLTHSHENLKEFLKTLD